MYTCNSFKIEYFVWLEITESKIKMLSKLI